MKRIKKGKNRSIAIPFAWFFLCVIVGACLFWWSWYKKEILTFTEEEINSQKNNLSELQVAKTDEIKEYGNVQNNSLKTVDVPIILPEEVKIEMGFLVQAPFRKWDLLHENACEEASLIMLKYFKSQKIWDSLEKADQEIKDLVNYETKKGYGPSIALQELLIIANENYPLELQGGRIIELLSIDQLKQELAEGNPIIVGVSGKSLNNPHFRNGGPDYHVLIIVGYNKEGFITHDPGISQGANYEYGYDILYDAIHNWNSDNIMSGQKVYLVFE